MNNKQINEYFQKLYKDLFDKDFDKPQSPTEDAEPINESVEKNQEEELEKTPDRFENPSRKTYRSWRKLSGF